MVISGGGGDANEALIFTFANPPGVNVNNVKLELIGLNYSTDMNGDPTDKADVIDLFLEFILFKIHLTTITLLFHLAPLLIFWT